MAGCAAQFRPLVLGLLLCLVLGAALRGWWQERPVEYSVSAAGTSRPTVSAVRPRKVDGGGRQGDEVASTEAEEWTTELTVDAEDTDTGGAVPEEAPRGGLCITTKGPYWGGLSNTVGIINMALVVAQRMRIPFLFPVVLPPSVRHNLTTDFADMFTDFDPEDGTPPTTHVPDLLSLDRLECKEGKLTDSHKCHAKDIEVVFPDGETRSVYNHYHLFHDKVEKARTQVDHATLTAEVDTHIVEGLRRHQCRTLITIPGDFLKQEFVYGPTHQALADAFFRHNPKAAVPGTVTDLFSRANEDQPRPVKVVLHHRLGDVAKYNDKGAHGSVAKKHLSPAFPMFCLMILRRVLRPGCIKVFISTDSPDHPEIDVLSSAVPHMSVNVLRDQLFVPGSRWSPARQSFESMVYADVLIAGSSGFSRLAAALSQSGLQMAPVIPSSSLDGVSRGLVQVGSGPWWDHFVTKQHPEEAANALRAASRLVTAPLGKDIERRIREIIAAQPDRFPVGCLHQ